MFVVDKCTIEANETKKVSSDKINKKNNDNSL